MRRIRISACEWTTTSLNRPTTRRASAAFGRPAREERMRALIISLICWLFIGPGAVATSQSQDPPDLIVRLRDVNGVGIAGVTVIVRDETGGRELARARTDAQGIASLKGFHLTNGGGQDAILWYDRACQDRINLRRNLCPPHCSMIAPPGN